MALIANIVVGIVALLHGYFLMLEMFLWEKSAGLRASFLLGGILVMVGAVARVVWIKALRMDRP